MGIEQPENKPERGTPGLGRAGRLARWWERVFGQPLRRVDDECRAFLATPASRRPDWKVMAVMVTVAVSLTIQNFFGHLNQAGDVASLLDQVGLRGLAERLRSYQEPTRLHELTYWAVATILTYTVLPILVIKLGFRERLSDYGLKVRGALKDFWIYGVMIGVMMPLVFLFSKSQHFQLTYPFYRVYPNESLWPDFWRWEMMYFCQFWALEFFFRGFIVHGTRHRFGLYSVFVMMAPYCMIHFGKPLPECFASIVAGIVLGFMSLKTRSIWLGAAVHVTVALSMDFASLWRQGFFS
jgi:membrane protease YdiL (CAAX protease family)